MCLAAKNIHFMAPSVTNLTQYLIKILSKNNGLSVAWSCYFAVDLSNVGGLIVSVSQNKL